LIWLQISVELDVAAEHKQIFCNSRVMMDNLSFAWREGFGMEFLLGENYSGGSISQIACDGDLSDEITYSG